ncbi:MaoC/PaaZ C-terminal domain-containing protein [Brevundimonas diminuta]|uniref:MaoC/PaaZ C-terminal domain-containing protein n=1 Tax=Brevundimonas diminuta TaxID=293 RepID=UPI003D02093E
MVQPVDQAQEMVSDWVEVTQTMIDDFGRATLDNDPFHNDPEWAKDNTPYGGTIAFGFLTVSLLTHLAANAIEGAGGNFKPAGGYFLNYGFDRMRLVAPVPTGSRVRGRFVKGPEHTDDAGRVRRSMDAVVEIEGGERPALVATWLSVWVPDSAMEERA